MNLMESAASVDQITQNQEEAFVHARAIAQLSTFTHFMRAAVELNVFDIIAEHGNDEPMSAFQIADWFPKQNVEKTPMWLDRMLSLFVSFSLLNVTEKGGDDQIQKLYTLSPVGKYFVKKNAQGSFATFLLFMTEPIQRDIWSCLKDAIIEGISPAEKAFKLPVFQVMSQQPETGKLFNKSMSELTTVAMKRLLETYKDFNEISSLVDVGGGDGSCLKMILSKYPHIKGINYDLPQVVMHKHNKPDENVPGLTHVGGDMFASVPGGDAIMLKNVLHNWGDEHCVQLLKRCYEAIPSSGKVIIIEAILPGTLLRDNDAKEAWLRDTVMFIHREGKERTREEFIGLSKASGFSEARFISSFSLEWIIEFHK